MKILVPTDYSPAAMSALHYAIALGKQLSAEVILYHAFHVPIGGDATFFADGDLLRRAEEDEQRRLQQVVGTVPEIYRVKHRLRTTLALPPEGIRQMIKQEGVSLVVMGSRGANDPSAAWLGSTTYSVMKHATCPVLAVPRYTATYQPKDVAFATDLQPTEETPPLDFIRRLLRAWGSTVHIIHVHPKPESIDVEQAEEALHLDRLFHDVPHSYHFLKGKDAADSIEAYLERHPMDLLVVMPRRHPLFQGMFQKSVTKFLTAHVPVPLLSLRQPS
jgi:nucleotide-binding universal stress UspA family protein